MEIAIPRITYLNDKVRLKYYTLWESSFWNIFDSQPNDLILFLKKDFNEFS